MVTGEMNVGEREGCGGDWGRVRRTTWDLTVGVDALAADSDFFASLIGPRGDDSLVLWGVQMTIGVGQKFFHPGATALLGSIRLAWRRRPHWASRKKASAVARVSQSRKEDPVGRAAKARVA